VSSRRRESLESLADEISLVPRVASVDGLQ
jgi:hypothetical protein